MPKQYEVKHSPARKKRGHKSWAVFEVIDPTFSRGLSFHDTEAEAIAAKAALEAANKAEG